MNFLNRFKKPYLMLAPMVGITDPIFRYLCSECGADYTYTEMVSPYSIIHGNDKSKRLISSLKSIPYSVQIFGNDYDILFKSMSIIEDEIKPTSIDINLGCPSKKITNSGNGSSLLNKTDNELYILFSDLNSVFKTPITTKIRILRDVEKTIKIAIALENANFQSITVHGRTKEMNYSNPVNLDIIEKIKNSLSIPVIANGDIYDLKTTMSTLKKTNCDGVMIGRAAIGNPEIFSLISSHLKDKKINNKNLDKNINTIKYEQLKEYLNLTIKYNYCSIVNFKQQTMYFMKGTTRAKKIRLMLNKLSRSNQYNKLNNVERMELILESINKIIN